MALQGTVKTNAYDGRYYQLDWTATQSVETNKSTIKWTLKAMTEGWWAERTLKVVIGGTPVYSKTDRVERWDGTITSGTTTISHDSSGKASFAISIQAAVYYTTVNCTGSATFTLDTIPRKSELSASNGTLGTALNLTVTKKSSSFTHTITYKCGSASGTICTKASGTSFTWNGDNGNTLALSSQNTKGTSVSVTFTITTYNGSTSIGSNTKTITMNIPASVKPSCSISVTDAAGHLTKYGAYVKSQSKFAVTVTPTIAYGSAIASYSVTANGVEYTNASFTTGVLTSSGALQIVATVKDNRSRSGTDEESVTVLDYSAPQITLLKVKRCKSLEDGTEDIYGEFCQVTFSAVITALNNRNSANYELQYKKTSEDWEKGVKIPLTDYANNYKITEGYYRFAADSGSSYNVRIIATDDFTDDTKTTPLSTGEVMEHWRADGKGMGFGKIGEIENGADFGWKIKANNGFINILLDPETDLNEVIKPNTYYGENVDAYNYLNCPVTSGTFTLEVASGGDDGQLMQTLTVTSKDKFVIYKRFYHSTDGVKSWGEWKQTYTATGNLLWSGAYYMKASQTATLSQKVSEQPHGIQLVFSGYTDGEAKDHWFNSFFISKYEVALHNGVGHNFLLTAGAIFQYLGEKYLYISDDKIVGLDNNERTGTGASGITYANNMFVLRYVIGV